ncbi:flavodoxin domain-containing protein, partial [Clostridium sp. ATCC 25772]
LTSHGPILSKDPMAQVKRYVEWSTETVNTTNQDQVAVLYLSAYTNTKVMAEKIYEGIKSTGEDATLYDIENMDLAELHDVMVMSKGILFGSPTINRTMVKPMWDAFSLIDPMANQGKFAGVFGSYGWSGEGITMAELLVKNMGFKMPVETLKKKFFPSDETLQECFDFGV